MKGSAFANAVVSAFLVLGLVMPAYALKDADYLKFKKESPEFAEADRQLQAVWKEVLRMVHGEKKAELMDDQKNWIQFVRDNVAEYIGYADKTLSPAEIYTRATLDRIRELKFYREYLKNPDKPVTVRGILEQGHNAVGSACWLMSEGAIIPYTLGMSSEMEDVGLETLIEKYMEEKTVVEVSGKLRQTDWFDTATLKIRPVQ